MKIKEIREIKVNLTDEEYICLSNALNILETFEIECKTKEIDLLQNAYEEYYDNETENTELANTINLLSLILHLSGQEENE